MMKQNILKFNNARRVLRWGILSLVATLFFSCSDSSYTDAIPRNVQMLMAIDASKTAGEGNEMLMKALLKTSSLDDSGLDLSEPLYCFETADGQFGFCAKVKDNDDLTDMLKEIAKNGDATEPKEGADDVHFSMLSDSWLMGYNDEAMLVLGPIAKTEFAVMQKKLSKMLTQDTEKGVRSSNMFEKLETLSAPITIVTQAQTLPEQFVSAFTLGAPKDADASQVILAAEMNVSDGVLNISGETFSFNKKTDEALKKAAQVYRPIVGKYVMSMPEDAVMGWFMNVDGNQFLPLLQADRGLQAMLAGINAAIDMDNILRSVNGDMALVAPAFSGENLQLGMAAQLKDSKWLADVDYWKQSCPPGGKITDWQKNAYRYSDGKTCFCFGVSDDLQFYSGSSEERALASIKGAEKPVSESLQKQITGAKMVMVVNLAAVEDGGGAGEVMLSLLEPLFGKVTTIVYSMK